MTADQIKTKIRDLTARIGRLKSRPDQEQNARRARLRRVQLAMVLAQNHDQWMLVNPQGRTEFVGREEFTRRMSAWIARRPNEDLGFGPRASLN